MRTPFLTKIVVHCTAGIALFLAFASNAFGASATSVALDKTTQGNWKGVYGADGFNIVSQGGTFPAYANVTFSGASQWIWNYDSLDPAALQKPAGNSRIASQFFAWRKCPSFTAMKPCSPATLSFRARGWIALSEMCPAVAKMEPMPDPRRLAPSKWRQEQSRRLRQRIPANGANSCDPVSC